ncbi:MAG TPA: hypothetical protein PLP17_15250, partial [Oligoflexia bacterium]|nr:hypothetical protein [Oligoflexia bacterium]
FRPEAAGRGWLDFLRHQAPTLTLKNDPRIGLIFRLFHTFWGLFVAHNELAIMLIMCFFAGCVLLTRRNPRALAVVLLVLITQAVLARLQLYPFAGLRYCLYLVPLFAIPVAVAFEESIRIIALLLRGKSVRRGFFWGAALLVICWAVWAAKSGAYHSTSIEFPLPLQNYQRALDLLRSEPESRDVVVTNRSSWLYLFYASSNGQTMYSSPAIGEMDYFGHAVYFDGRPYFWEYARSDDFYRFFLLLLAKHDLSTVHNIWFLVLGVSDYSMLTLRECLGADAAFRLIMFEKGALLFSLNKDFLLEQLGGEPPLVTACFERSSIPQMGSVFGP